MPRLPLVALAALTPLLTLAGCGGDDAGAETDHTVHVVAGENFWGDITSQIGGSHVEVTSIISDPDTNPHEYESDPDDAAALARADLVVENGAGYDDFLAKLIGASGAHPDTLDVAKLVGATAEDVNPHLWYSPTYVATAATEIERRLAAADPADAGDFEAGLRHFTSAYAPYVALVAQIKAAYAGTPISYTERVPGYLVDAAGLKLGTPPEFSQAVEEDTDPSPASTKAFDDAITDHQVAVLLYNSQVVDAQTTKLKALATTARVPIVGVSETVPTRYDSFAAWQIAQARQLLSALGGSR